jgi:chromosome segregation ATPase
MLAGMKDKGPVLLLLLVAVGLGIALIVVRKQAADQRRDAADSLAVASNTVTSVQKQKDELLVVNQTLETNLAATRMDFSNKIALADADLHTAEANLEKVLTESKAAAKAQADSNALLLSQRDQRITELESQNAALDREDASLRVAMTNLDARIADTQAKLASSEGDRDFLKHELKVLKAEKEDMEKRFNDIAAVRLQLHKLKIEASINHRLDRLRRDIEETFKEKGDATPTTPPSTVPPENGGAAVELRQGGGVKIEVPPTTNAPPK